MPSTIFNSWVVSDVALHCSGTVIGRGDLPVKGLTNDGRKAGRGDVFVALKAERDGHEFVLQALENGVQVFLIARDAEQAVYERLSQGADAFDDRQCAMIAVDDTYEAMADIGRAIWSSHGQQVPGRVTLAVTGSNGKTTTKDFLGALLESAYPGEVFSTPGNLNSHIGLPISLTGLSTGHRYVVLEMGSSGLGDIAYLVGIAPIERALVTCVSAAHLEGLGEEVAVVKEKGAIFQGNPPAAVAVIPQQLKGEGLLSETYPGEVRLFGAGEESAVQVCDYRQVDGRARVQVKVSLEGGESLFELFPALSGRHNAENMASAIALVWDLIPESERIERIQQTSERYQGVLGRSQWHCVADGGAWVLDDAYNANPASMAAALALLSEKEGSRWAIIGDMMELGRDSDAYHREAGRRAGEAGCHRVWAVGGFAEIVLAGARSVGVQEVCSFESADQCASHAVGQLGRDDVILVKGSRSVGLEQVVEALRKSKPLETGQGKGRG